MKEIQTTFTPQEELAWSVKKTAGCRFNAAKRLERRQKFLVFMITIFTVGQLGLSILLISITNENNIYIKIIATISILMSVFIVLLSNTEAITKDTLNAYLLHKCGLELSYLSKKISIHTNISKDEYLELSNNYNSILVSCNLNHENIDFIRAGIQLNNPKGWKVCVIHPIVSLRSILATYGFYFACLLAFIGIVALIHFAYIRLL